MRPVTAIPAPRTTIRQHLGLQVEDLVDEAEGMKILTERHDGGVARVASNSFGFGGTNACLVFDKYEG